MDGIKFHMIMFASSLHYVSYKDVLCLIEGEKGFILILETQYSLGSGIWLFPFHHVIEVEARWNMNMELDPDILHIWFGPTVRSKLPPGASYPKLIYFLFSWSKYTLPQAFGVNSILWLFISTIRACLFDSSLFLSSKNLNVPQQYINQAGCPP